MRIHYIQHVPFEGPGCIKEWCLERGVSLTSTKQHLHEPLPAPEELDGLIVLGGPMSVNEEGSISWISQEKSFLRSAIACGLPILGICLGAQMIASALGARVYRNPMKEIGWFEVETMSGAASATGFRFPGRFTAFHWHGETFDLPVGSVWLARSAGCENQAFQFGERVFGLQFHLEVRPAGVRDLLTFCRADISTGRYVQTQEQLLYPTTDHYVTANHIMTNLLTYLFKQT